MKCPKCHFDNPEDTHFCGNCAAPLHPSEEISVSKTKTLETPKEELTRGTVLAGRYEIIEELGKGGMGKVYRVEDTKIEEEVALKLIRPEITADKKTIERFKNELKTARKITHKNVCRMYHLGEEKGICFITMEYIPGEDLRTLIRRVKQLTVGTAISIAKQIAEGLVEAHHLGIVHRDLKPSNIMIDKKGNARIMDFGIARSIEARGITGERAMIGTLEYMSPEQVEGKEADQRSDIYSLGIILYEMVTGRIPFEGETSLDIAMKHKSEVPKDPEEINPQIPDDLSDLIMKCLEKDKEKRYQSAEELLAGLGEIEKEIPTTHREIPRSKPLTTKEVIAAFSAKKLFIPTFLIMALVIIGLVFWHPWKRDKTIPFSERDWILITDFENLTGDEVFDQSLNTALRVSIQQSRYVNVFPQTRLKETLQRMGRETLDKLDLELGREIAQREGIKALVACSINLVGDVYNLTVSIINPDTQVVMMTEKSQAKGKDRVLSTLDDLAGKIRKDLGESLRDIEEKSIGLPIATTSSLEALKKYAVGNKFWEARQFNEAASLWQEAIELDSNFALAHAALGGHYYSINERPQGETHFVKALSLKDQLTEREKLWLPARVEQWRQNREEAIRHFKIYLSSYPQDIEGWTNLGRNYMFLRRFSEALEAFNKVLEIDRLHAQNYINIATCYNLMEKPDESILNYLEAFKLRPEWITNSNLNHEFGQAYVKMGEIQKAEEIYEMMLSKGDSAKARGHRSLALLCMYQGKYSTAADHLKESILLNKTLKQKLSEYRDRMYLATVYQAKGMTDHLKEQLQAVEELRSKTYLEPWWLLIVGKVYARGVDIEKANDILKEISTKMNEDNRVDRLAYNILKGEIELAKGNHAEAKELFEMAYKLRDDNYALESVAHGYLLSGDLDQAIAKYELLIDKKDWGWEAQEYWIRAYSQVGKIYDVKGNAQRAIHYYQRFLDILKDADPGLPDVEDVKIRLAGLKSQ